MVLMIVRVVLVAVFLVAGLTKLADLAGSRQALRDFGVPVWLANPLGLLLPLAELAVAVALLSSLLAWWGALGALILLFLFIAGISVNLARGRKPDCHCFGQLHSAPVGWSTLIRNGVLAALAGFIVWQGPEQVGPSMIGWLATLTIGETLGLTAILITLVLVIVEGWFLFNLLGQNGRLLLRIEALEQRLSGGDSAVPPSQIVPTGGLPVGTLAPTFQLSDIHEEPHTLEDLRAPGQMLMLIFTDPGCGPCTELLPEIAGWQHEYAAKLKIALISQGLIEMNRAKSSEHGLAHVLLQRNREVADAYRVYGNPGAVLVQADGTIGSSPALGGDAIRMLLARTVDPSTSSLLAVPAINGNPRHRPVATAARPALPKIGEPAPPLKLSDLEGKHIDLADFQGTPTLVLFWNPSCGFCQRMLNDLKTWEMTPPQGAPKLLIVSTGTVQDNKAMGLSSPIVLDQSFSTGRIFGANGTPTALLIDAQGNIASEVVAGAPAVLALATGKETLTLTSR